MVSVAAGMARAGTKPWVYSIAPFCYARPFEQIRNDVCLNASARAVGGQRRRLRLRLDGGHSPCARGLRGDVDAPGHAHVSAGVRCRCGADGARPRQRGPRRRICASAAPSSTRKRDSRRMRAWRRLQDGEAGVIVVAGPDRRRPVARDPRARRGGAAGAVGGERDRRRGRADGACPQRCSRRSRLRPCSASSRSTSRRAASASSCCTLWRSAGGRCRAWCTRMRAAIRRAATARRAGIAANAVSMCPPILRQPHGGRARMSSTESLARELQGPGPGAGRERLHRRQLDARALGGALGCVRHGLARAGVATRGLRAPTGSSPSTCSRAAISRRFWTACSPRRCSTAWLMAPTRSSRTSSGCIRPTWCSSRS